MLFQRFRPLEGSGELSDVREDFRKSRRLEKYRLGKLALYFPAGFSWEYLPLSEIDSFRRVTRLIESENGVCPFSMEVPSVRIFFRDKNMVLEIEKEISTAALLRVLGAAQKGED